MRLGNFAGDLEKVMLELMAIPSNDARRGFTPSMLRTELSSRILNIANYLMARYLLYSIVGGVYGAL